MKKRILLALTALFMGVLGMWADTNLLTEADGWHKITSISQDEIADNYYVFVADGQDLMLHSAAPPSTSVQYRNANTTVLFSMTSVQPSHDLSTVFTLEAYNSVYTMRNLKYPTYVFQASSNKNRWHCYDQTAACSWSAMSLNYADGAWTIESSQNGRMVGVYDTKEDISSMVVA